jgi:hypothetical protein
MTSSFIGRIGSSTAIRSGSITPCIILRKIWSGSPPPDFHPINLFFGAVLADVVTLLAGISPNIFVVLGPITIAHSGFVHANLDWTLGLFKYVIASPVFHRWHHTAAERGGEKNFAATSRSHLRHVLHAERRAAGPLRHRGQGISGGLRRPTRLSVQE